MTTLTPARMGNRQQTALTALKMNRAGLTAPQVRDALGLEGSDGTRQAYGVLTNFVEHGWAERIELTEKAAFAMRQGTTGRTPKAKFKITAEGRAALKAA